MVKSGKSARVAGKTDSRLLSHDAINDAFKSWWQAESGAELSWLKSALRVCVPHGRLKSTDYARLLPRHLRQRVKSENARKIRRKSERARRDDIKDMKALPFESRGGC